MIFPQPRKRPQLFHRISREPGGMGCFYILSGCGFGSCNRVCGNCFFRFCLHHDYLLYSEIANPLATTISRLNCISIMQYSKLTGRHSINVVAYCTVLVALSGKFNRTLTLVHPARWARYPPPHSPSRDTGGTRNGRFFVKNRASWGP